MAVSGAIPKDRDAVPQDGLPPGRRGWAVAGVVESPITGPEGNREFLLAAVRS